jgi:hypothetical protein
MLVAVRRHIALGLSLVITGGFLCACSQSDEPKKDAGGSPGAAPTASPTSIPMGGEKSVMRFFVTSKGLGKGGDLGGLAGADAHCQALATAQKAGDHTWRAYLSTQASSAGPAVNARDRIGRGPWYNAEGDLIAQNVAELHGKGSKLDKETTVHESNDPVEADMHEILTGSRPDGTAFEPGADRTCGNWTSSTAGNAQVGYSDQTGEGENPNSWNSARPTNACSMEGFKSRAGAGLFYCFAID